MCDTSIIISSNSVIISCNAACKSPDSARISRNFGNLHPAIQRAASPYPACCIPPSSTLHPALQHAVSRPPTRCIPPSTWDATQKGAVVQQTSNKCSMINPCKYVFYNADSAETCSKNEQQTSNPREEKEKERESNVSPRPLSYKEKDKRKRRRRRKRVRAREKAIEEEIEKGMWQLS